MRSRLGLLAPALVAAPLWAAACGVPVGGISGLTLTADGQVAVVIEMCHRSVDGVELYESNDDRPQDSVDHGRWDSPGQRYSSMQYVAESSTPASPWTTTIA